MGHGWTAPGVHCGVNCAQIISLNMPQIPENEIGKTLEE
jgi:hypothetical protein